MGQARAPPQRMTAQLGSVTRILGDKAFPASMSGPLPLPWRPAWELGELLWPSKQQKEEEDRGSWTS